MESRKEAYILAIHYEIKSQNLYRSLAKSFKQENVSRTFLNLVPLEEMHEEKLRDGFQREFPNETLAIDEEKVKHDVPADIVNDPKSILEFAVGREELAHEAYLRLAQGCVHADMKELFLQFAEEESNHKTILQTEIQRIQGLISWYDPSELNGLVEE
ncbi:MAG TPA: ferritin family protein [Candidatus Cloacimonadota bacterium]|nr:ferritin family protein [Candidatus Cloacimonadota bacterium]HPT70928.1 ferritin family protein [Candidatus Cloacimonadota bacterium]